MAPDGRPSRMALAPVPAIFLRPLSNGPTTDRRDCITCLV